MREALDEYMEVDKGAFKVLQRSMGCTRFWGL